MLLPIKRMIERVEIEKEDSDSAYFNSLMYLGEMVMKLTISGLVAAIRTDRDNHRYRAERQLVRADSLGSWVTTLDEILTGRTSQSLHPSVRETQRCLTQRQNLSWQIEAIDSLDQSLKCVQVENSQRSGRIRGSDWFRKFVELRNDTRGHGAVSSSALSEVCPHLRKSIEKMATELPLLHLPWAYIRRNLSGKYRVTYWGQSSDRFERLKRDAYESYQDGVYLDISSPDVEGLQRVNLVDSKPEASDFWFPNGGFTSARYESISYLTNDKAYYSSKPYLTPVEKLPPSETQGIGQLDLTGASTLSNVPAPLPDNDYVRRNELESEIVSELKKNDTHPIVTLTGRGGIGKTSTALKVIHDLMNDVDNPYAIVIWFSSRDIDLLQAGPKSVRPDGVSIDDFAKEYVRLMEPGEKYSDGIFSDKDYLANHLSTEEIYPTLFVFDNFETTDFPVEVFHWLDTYVRAPNKVLITSRVRQFKGDFPVYVHGMTPDECKELVGNTARTLRLHRALSQQYVEELITESDGHPYIIKLMLGEIARTGNTTKPERVMAGRDEVLTALFERSYTRLPPGAQRVFLTLCTWRSSVPAIAVEAVLSRPANEDPIDVQEAIDELIKSSFVEEWTSGSSNEIEITVPLPARLFGGRKLKVSAWRASIKADSEILRMFGAQSTGTEVTRRIRRLVNSAEQDLDKGNRTREEIEPILQYLATKYPSVWVHMANLTAKFNWDGLSEEECLLRYAEASDEQYPVQSAWQRIAQIRENRHDYRGAIDALAQVCRQDETPIDDISNAANRINAILRNISIDIDSQEKSILVQDVVGVLESSINELNATDLSRLSWLYRNLGKADKAFDTARRGLAIDPDNQYCRGIVNG